MRDHEHERRAADRPDERPPERPKPIHNVLALQRTAGNQAVAGMLARQPVAEESTGGADKQQAVGKVTLTKIGVIPISSFSAGIASGRPPQSTDFTFTSTIGDHSVKLMQALADGTLLNGELDVQGFRMKIHSALVTSYSSGTSGGDMTESWTLTPQHAHVDDGSGGGGGGGGGSWDDSGGQPG